MRALFCAAIAAFLVAGGAHAASSVVQYGPPPAWAQPPPKPTEAPPQEGAPVRFLNFDTQVHVGAAGQETYTAYRVKILKPEGLSVGNIVAAWSPASDDITVHRLQIVRDGRVIDVLKDSKFRVIEREDRLDYAMLDGNLTATLQTPGLQVGDEFEFAVTSRHRDLTLGGKPNGFVQLPIMGTPGAFRVRLSWPKTMALRWRATPDLGQIAVDESGGEQVLSYELRDPRSVILAEGAPDRFNVRRLLQFTDFASWGELSNLVSQLFDHAATLSPNSPIRAEAARIAASTTDPRARAEQALRLVQDRIRYVFVGLDDGAYRPVDADKTWERRFGDCKAKTVLLLALLRELGVPAEAVLVNTAGGDGTDQRLPTPQAFNHVLVRATIGGRPYWLDGTRLDGGRMEGLTVPFRWALPLRAGAVDLEPVSPEAPILPTMSMLLEVDATAGFDVPAKVKVEQVLRGDEAMILKAHLSSLSPEDAERGLKTYWRQTEAWVDADKAAWRYDPTQSALVFTMTGEGKVDWDGDDKDGRSHNIEGAGFTPPDPLKRPKEQDQTVPWKTDFPNFRRWTTVIRLPPATPKWRWTYKAATVDEKLGGVAYWRHAELRDGVMRTTMSRRTYLPEITAGQAKEIGERLPKFDNNISQIYQQSDEGAVDKVSAARLEAAAGRDAERLADIATYMLMNKRYDEALRAYDKALAVDPKLRKASYGKADTLRRKGDVLGALRYLDDLARTDRDPELPLAKAYLLIVAGRTAEGLAQVDSLMPSLVGKTDLLAKAADAYLQARAYDRSAAAATAAIASSPDNVYARSVRASAYDRLGRSPEALEDSEAAIRLQPEEPGLFVNRGLILEKLGRYDQALADFDEVARISPLEFDVAGPRARVLRRLGRLDESKTAYAAWVAADKGGVALNSRCWDRALANIDLADAEADCAEAVKREPKTAHYWDSYALVALRAGRFQEAVKRYDEALALEPKLAPSLFGRGVAKRRAGDAAGGDADIQAARTIQADAGAELTQAGVTP